MQQSWWVKKREEGPGKRREEGRSRVDREDKVSEPERQRACGPEGNQLSCGSLSNLPYFLILRNLCLPPSSSC